MTKKTIYTLIIFILILFNLYFIKLSITNLNEFITYELYNTGFTNGKYLSIILILILVFSNNQENINTIIKKNRLKIFQQYIKQINLAILYILSIQLIIFISRILLINNNNQMMLDLFNLSIFQTMFDYCNYFLISLIYLIILVKYNKIKSFMMTIILYLIYETLNFKYHFNDYNLFINYIENHQMNIPVANLIQISFIILAIYYLAQTLWSKKEWY